MINVCLFGKVNGLEIWLSDASWNNAIRPEVENLSLLEAWARPQNGEVLYRISRRLISGALYTWAGIYGFSREMPGPRGDTRDGFHGVGVISANNIIDGDKCKKFLDLVFDRFSRENTRGGQFIKSIKQSDILLPDISGLALQRPPDKNSVISRISTGRILFVEDKGEAGSIPYLFDQAQINPKLQPFEDIFISSSKALAARASGPKHVTIVSDFTELPDPAVRAPTAPSAAASKAPAVPASAGRAEGLQNDMRSADQSDVAARLAGAETGPYLGLSPDRAIAGRDIFTQDPVPDQPSKEPILSEEKAEPVTGTKEACRQGATMALTFTPWSLTILLLFFLTQNILLVSLMYWGNHFGEKPPVLIEVAPGVSHQSDTRLDKGPIKISFVNIKCEAAGNGALKLMIGDPQAGGMIYPSIPKKELAAVGVMTEGTLTKLCK